MEEPEEPYWLSYDGWVYSRRQKMYVACFGGCTPSLSSRWEENRKNAFGFIEALTRKHETQRLQEPTGLHAQKRV